MPYDVVVFGAHPDDAEMGMGGTIAKLGLAGRSVILVSLTRGERGTYGSEETRATEAKAAAQILRCEYRLLDFPDTRVPSDLDARDRLVDILRELEPELVFAPYYTNPLGHHDGAAHVDHLATGALVRDAVKLARMRGVESKNSAHDVRRLFYYMVPRNRYPTFCIDVTGEMDTLQHALQAYRTQMRIERQGNTILDILQTYRRFYGIAAGCTYAEPFLCEDTLHVDTETLFRV